MTNFVLIKMLNDHLVYSINIKPLNMLYRQIIKDFITPGEVTNSTINPLFGKLFCRSPSF